MQVISTGAAVKDRPEILDNRSGIDAGTDDTDSADS
jgi:hypothetical protein